jgi:3-oxoacyl-[acyl-carrier-protein] synthase III
MIMSKPIISIAGTGIYLPEKIITSETLDQKLGKESGWVRNKSGVIKRYFSSEHETTSFMAVKAAIQAVENSGIKMNDIDCIISASGGMEQAIPSTSSIISRDLGLEKAGITTFDVNSTCLSFLSALDIASCMIEARRFNHVLIVSSEIPSLSMNWKDMESCTIFGDGAAAAVVTNISEKSKNNIRVLSSHFATYSDGIEHCQIRSGGTKLHPNKGGNDYAKYAFFEMNGKATYKFTAELLPKFLKNLFDKAGLKISDIDLFIPHQASKLAIRHLQDRVKIPEEKLINIFSENGNQVAASIPSALHHAFITNKIKNGDRILLLGTSAGISVGGMLLQYRTE